MSDTNDTNDRVTVTGSDDGLGEVTIVRVSPGSIELVFDCMTTPEHLTHFWGPTGTSTPLDGIVVDLRPGGAFETLMVNDADGSEYPMKAVYVDVDRPNHLSWTEPDVEGGMLSSITFRAIDDDHTEVTIHQTNVPAMFRSPEALAGFQTSLVRGDAYIAGLVAARKG